MIDYQDWDPNPHVVGLQLSAFMSFMRNQSKWNNATNFTDNIEWEDALWVRGTPSLEKLFISKN